MAPVYLEPLRNRPFSNAPGEDPSRWFEIYAHCSALYRYSEREQCEQIVAYLRNEAKKWYRKKIASKVFSFQLLYELFYEEFIKKSSRKKQFTQSFHIARNEGDEETYIDPETCLEVIKPKLQIEEITYIDPRTCLEPRKPKSESVPRHKQSQDVAYIDPRTCMDTVKYGQKPAGPLQNEGRNQENEITYIDPVTCMDFSKAIESNPEPRADSLKSKESEITYIDPRTCLEPVEASNLKHQALVPNNNIHITFIDPRTCLDPIEREVKHVPIMPEVSKLVKLPDVRECEEIQTDLTVSDVHENSNHVTVVHQNIIVNNVITCSSSNMSEEKSKVLRSSNLPVINDMNATATFEHREATSLRPPAHDNNNNNNFTDNVTSNDEIKTAADNASNKQKHTVTDDKANNTCDECNNHASYSCPRIRTNEKQETRNYQDKDKETALGKEKIQQQPDDDTIDNVSRGKRKIDFQLLLPGPILTKQSEPNVRKRAEYTGFCTQSKEKFNHLTSTETITETGTLSHRPTQSTTTDCIPECRNKQDEVDYHRSPSNTKTMRGKSEGPSRLKHTANGKSKPPDKFNRNTESLKRTLLTGLRSREKEKSNPYIQAYRNQKHSWTDSELLHSRQPEISQIRA